MKTKSKSPIITVDWLKSNIACEEGMKWFTAQKAKSLSIVVKKLLKQQKFDWANWVLVRFMTQQQYVQYAVYAGSLSINAFEKVFPEDKRPREALLAALKWSIDPNEHNRFAAESAAE